MPAFFRKAMKGEKGIAGVSVSEGLGEELSEETFGKLHKYRPYLCFIL